MAVSIGTTNPSGRFEYKDILVKWESKFFYGVDEDIEPTPRIEVSIIYKNHYRPLTIFTDDKILDPTKEHIKYMLDKAVESFKELRGDKNNG